jgi:hypothetical protein
LTNNCRKYEGRKKRLESFPSEELFSKGFPGTDVMTLKLFSPKISEKTLAFSTQNKAKLCKHFTISLVFEKKRQFFRRKLAKFAKNVIITSTPAVM